METRFCRFLRVFWWTGWSRRRNMRDQILPETLARDLVAWRYIESKHFCIPSGINSKIFFPIIGRDLIALDVRNYYSFTQLFDAGSHTVSRRYSLWNDTGRNEQNGKIYNLITRWLNSFTEMQSCIALSEKRANDTPRIAPRESNFGKLFHVTQSPWNRASTAQSIFRARTQGKSLSPKRNRFSYFHKVTLIREA